MVIEKEKKQNLRKYYGFDDCDEDNNNLCQYQ